MPWWMRLSRATPLPPRLPACAESILPKPLSTAALTMRTRYLTPRSLRPTMPPSVPRPPRPNSMTPWLRRMPWRRHTWRRSPTTPPAKVELDQAIAELNAEIARQEAADRGNGEQTQPVTQVTYQAKHAEAKTEATTWQTAMPATGDASELLGETFVIGGTVLVARRRIPVR